MQSLIALGLLAGTTLGLPAPGRVVHEKRDTPVSYDRIRLEHDAIIPIRIALRQNNLHNGEAYLMDVSDPFSKNFGKHWTPQEVHDHFAPSEDTISAVKNWLIDSGIHNDDIVHYENKGWLALDLPASTAERLLEAEYFEYKHGGSLKIGCDSYSLPSHLTEHIDFIKPAVKLSAPLKKSLIKRDSEGWGPGPGWGPGHHRPGPPHFPPQWPHWQPPPHAGGLPADLRDCGVNITPTCIKALYNIPAAHLSQPENVMGLFEEGDAYAQEALNLFWKKFAPNVPQGTGPKVDSVDGGTAPVPIGSYRDTGESDIDLQLTYSLIYPQEVIVYEVDDINYSTGVIDRPGFFNTFLDAVDGSYCNYTAFGITGDSPKLDPTYPDKHKNGFKGQLECGKYQLTRVLSVSYGEPEVDLPKAYSQRQCSEIMKLGLQGHSLFVASGDYGVASFPGSNGDEFGCLSSKKYGQNGTIYNPDFSSSCPYWTSVGATRLYPNQTVNDLESAMQVNLTAFNIATGVGGTSPPLGFFASSGGFSNDFSPPAYQQAAVSNYLANYVNKSLPYYVINEDRTNIGENGGVYNYAGRGWPDVSANGAFLLTYVNATVETFFGTSLASPIFASVITLINEERSAAGKGPVGFVNPTLYAHPYVLNDIVNGSNPNCGSSGFAASEGWDPVTGLGTPNYPKMLELFMSLP